MNKQIVHGFVGGTILLLAGLVNGCSYAEQNLGIQGKLREARMKLDANYTGSQVEMTIVSEFQLNLAMMELHHMRYTICNQSNYGKIEAAFLEDEQAWERRFKKEQEKSSEYEGGSMSPMDHNMRMTAFAEQRIAELKTKWCQK